ncbi:hypothetical protein KC851_01775 [Candidatus Kaiserbacteria bacterium]|nr:hypothetical protein [Candidatus Kaiserbacteria bacterium]
MKQRIFVHDVGLKPQLLYFLEGLMRKNRTLPDSWFCRLCLRAQVGVIGNDLPVSYINSGCVQGPVSYFRPRKVRLYAQEVIKVHGKSPRMTGKFSRTRNSWGFFVHLNSIHGVSLYFILCSYGDANLGPIVEGLFNDHEQLMSVVVKQVARRIGSTSISEAYEQNEKNVEFSSFYQL